MGKKAFQIKFDKNTLKNVVKNFTPAGYTASVAQGLGLTKNNLVDEGFNAITGQKRSNSAPAGDPNAGLKSDVDKQVEASRNAALGLIGDLQSQSRGTAPSIAEAQMRQAGNRTLAQQLSAAAAQRGGNQAMLQRALVASQGQQGRELAEQAAGARLQEQQQARQQLGNLVLGQQQQDLSQVISPRQLTMQDALERFRVQETRKSEKEKADRQLLGGVLGSASGAGGLATMAMSDETEKKNVKDSKKSVKDMLDKLSAKKYEYKDTTKPGTAEGKRHGILAQDLEKSEMGKSMVKESEAGEKMIDTVQGFGAILAAQAELNKRLKKLEGK